jgi:hypothetical protein
MYEKEYKEYEIEYKVKTNDKKNLRYAFGIISLLCITLLTIFCVLLLSYIYSQIINLYS